MRVAAARGAARQQAAPGPASTTQAGRPSAGRGRTDRLRVALLCMAVLWVGLALDVAAPAGASSLVKSLAPVKILPCFGTKCPVTHTVNFDNGAVGLGQQITSQYQGDGVYFADPFENGFQSGEPQPGQNLVSTLACGGEPTLFAPEGGLTSSPPDAAQFSACGSLEFPDHGTFGFFTSGVSNLSADVGQVSASGSRYELDAYNQAHELIGSSTITAGKAGILNPISFTAPAGQLVWAFAIYDPFGSGQFDFGMDDLYYSIPAGQLPQISLTSNRTYTGGIVPSAGSLTVTVNRFDGSTGEVDLAVTGMPPGVTASFSPAALTGTQTTSTLNWAITSAADGGTPTQPAGSTLTVTAAPAVPAAGASPAPPVSIGFEASLPYGWRPGVGPVTLADCSTLQVYGPSGSDIFFVPSSISGHGSLSVNGAGPGTGLDSATLSPSTFSNGSAEPVLTVSAGPKAAIRDDTLTLSAAAPGYATETTIVLVHRIVGQITSWTGAGGNDNVVEAPHWGTSSQSLTIYGSGFCPGTKVAFGEYGSPPSIGSNSPALVTPSYISPDGTEMKVTVPHYAADGPIDVFTPGGSFSSSAHLTIADGFAATDGYNFANRAGPGVGLSDLANVFPQDEVYVQVDPCSGLSFGIVDCSLGSTGIGTPQADIFLNSGGSSIAKGGECYGFSTSSLFLTGLPGLPVENAVKSYDSSANNVNEIADNGAVDNYILDMQISQGSSESLNQRASAASTASGDSAAQFESQLRGDLVTYDGFLNPVVVDMFGTVKGQFSGHSVVAYDVQATGGGNFDIYVYNPNTPYNNSVSGDSAGATSNWVSNQQNSVIHVKANGSWSFPQIGYTGTLSTGNLYLLPADSLPSSYDLPGSFTFGNILASAPSSGQLDQVTDASGHTLLGPAGSLNRSPSGIPGAKLVYNIVGPGGTAAPQALLPVGGSYTLTLSPSKGSPSKGSPGKGSPGPAGTVAGGLVGPSLSASVQGTAGGKVSFGLNSKTGTVLLRPGKAGGAFTTDLALAGAKGADRTATLTISAGSTGTFTAQLTPAGSLRLADAGGSARVSVELGSVAPAQLPAAFATSPLPVGAGTAYVLRPASWAHLGSSPVTLRTTGRSGKVTSKLLRTTLSAGHLRSVELSVHHSGQLAVVGVAGSWSPGASGAGTSGAGAGSAGGGAAGGGAAGATTAARQVTTAIVAWVVLQGHRVVAHHLEQVRGSKLARVDLSWAVKGLHRGSYRVVGSVLISTSAPGAVAAVSASKATSAALVVG
ncbi:MAG TPA: hypothetical protein VMF65_22060 [Acidimicrobiales bacterium]|nr:hypothetical protein [Acidimicrobiales bacterium]